MGNNEDYNVNSIEVLEGLDAVRRRPGMYIASTNEKGLHHLVWEIVDNAIDEAMAGYATDIEVVIGKNNIVTVKDNGRGVPVGIHPKTGKSTVETIYTVLHAGGKFGGGGYKVSGGLHGVGSSVVNALSSFLEVRVYRDNKIYYQRFENGGHPVESLKVIGECENRTGTEVTFKPDPTIFTETTMLNYETIYDRLEELAYLNKGIKITLIDEREEPNLKEEFLYYGGLSSYVKKLNKNKEVIQESVIDIEGVLDDISIEVAMQYNDGYQENIYSFVNNIITPEGGTHEDGIKRALTRVINNYGRKAGLLKDKDENLSGEDVREGLTMVISCKHPNPQFEGQTKTKLGNSDVRAVADRVFSENFERFLLENPDEARIIVDKAKLATRARIAAKKARDITRKSPTQVSGLPGKLVDCSSRDPSECEIFIVEGNSAGGSAKEGRDSKTQAILPLRGKILNVEKTRLDRILNNKEIVSMITAFGTGIGDEFDIKKLRYHKIIIMTDADVDGSHIRILLLTFFYRYFRPLVEGGYIYAAQPPLYQISQGKKVSYAYSDEERDQILEEFSNKDKIGIQRYKGLGEMDAEQLWETTMNHENRVLWKITVEDAMKADMVLSDLMGEDVAPRKLFLENNARYVENLDV